MRRRLYAFAAIVSAMLCLAVVVEWARSYLYHDSFDVSGSPTIYLVANSGHGGLSLRLLTGQVHAAGPMSIESYSYASQPGLRPLRLNWPQYSAQAGADFSSGAMVPNMTRIVVVPFWLAALVAAIVPAWWTVARRRRRALELAGHCRKCGYDLRASTDRCPECGTPIPAMVKE